MVLASRILQNIGFGVFGLPANLCCMFVRTEAVEIAASGLWDRQGIDCPSPQSISIIYFCLLLERFTGPIHVDMPISPRIGDALGSDT